MTETCDLIIIGLDVGGIEIATQAAAGGLAVTAVEQNLVGGECPYWGCIPSKVMVRAGGARLGDRPSIIRHDYVI
jgi:pyruvate/2-oxoglutarate dehydrogenase complex dihydrolipoamide dehydrogenase (E3) component